MIDAHFCQLMMMSVLFLDIWERRYPEHFRTMLTECTLKAIYAFSKTQILFSKVWRQMDAFVESNHDLQELRNKWKVVFQKEAEKPYQYLRDGVLQLTISSHLKDDGFTVLKKVLYPSDEVGLVYEGCDIKFILMEFTMGKTTYKIDLKSDLYNYYVVGNEFRKEFFLYFLERYQFLSLLETDDCKVRLIDHEVETIEVQFTDKRERIVLDKTGYRIL